MWGLSADSIRRLFDDEPGVLVIGDTNHQHKRRYRTLRIPQSVIERVHRRMCRNRIPLADAFNFNHNRFLGMECASNGIVVLTPSSWELR